MRKTLALACFLISAVAPVAAQAATAEVVDVSSSGSVASTASSLQDRNYMVQVHGVYSAYNSALMGGTFAWKVCGVPTDPSFAPGHSGDNAGQDAESIFAYPTLIRRGCASLPLAHGNF
jgi:hypothetical protein